MVDAHRICLEGEYDLTRRDEIARLFDSLNDDEAVAIDLTNVTYLDSTVLKELARLRARSVDRTISLIGVNDNIMRVLKIVAFDRSFDVSS